MAKKLLGSAPKIRVGRGALNTHIFFLALDEFSPSDQIRLIRCKKADLDQLCQNFYIIRGSDLSDVF